MKIGSQLAWAVMVGLAAARGANAETLSSALDTAMTSNPTLLASRAQYLSTAANTAIAIAQGRPTIDLSAQVTRGFGANVFGYGVTDESTLALTIPLYEGGRVRHAVQAASLRASAAQLGVQSTEIDIRQRVVEAYANVLNADEALRLQNLEVDRLSENLKMNQDQFALHAVTLTDVAQSRARLAGARARQFGAERDAAQARESYRQLVGREPQELAELVAPDVPFTIEEATRIAMSQNPALLSLRRKVEAAIRDVQSQRSSGRPSLSLTASVNYGDNDQDVLGQQFFSRRWFGKLGIRLTVPIYQGGQVSAQISRARALQAQAVAQEANGSGQVVQLVRTAYIDYVSSIDAERVLRQGVKANREALEGVKIERTSGDRSALDVLNAEQELLAAELALNNAHRQTVVRAAAIFNTMGVTNAMIPATARPAEHAGFDESLVRLADETVPAVPVAAPTPHRLAIDPSIFDDSRVTRTAALTYSATRASLQQVAVVKPLAYDLNGLG